MVEVIDEGVDEKVPSVSIIIPAFNSAETIAECLASVQQQDRSDLEIVVIDDGSMDKTLELCQSFAAQDSRIRVLTQANAGPSAARNTGLLAALGTYVLFLDSDDWLEPNSLPLLLSNADATGAEATRATYRMVFPDMTTRTAALKIPAGLYTGKKDMTDLKVAFMENREQGFSVLWLLKRSAISGAKFPADITYMEDVVFLAQVLERLGSTLITDLLLYNYRQSEGSLVRTPERTLRNTLETFTVIEQILDSFPSDSPVTPDQISSVINQRLERLGRMICFAVEDHSLTREEFKVLASALAADERFSIFLKRATGKQSLTRPLLTSLVNGRTQLAWIQACLYATVWRGYRYFRDLQRFC